MKNKLFLFAIIFIFIGFVANVQAQEVKTEKKENTEKKIPIVKKVRVEKKEAKKTELESVKVNNENKSNNETPKMENEEQMYEETRGEPVPGAAVYIEEGQEPTKLTPAQNNNAPESTEKEKPEKPVN